jgi:hypothetical protein
MQKHSSVYCQGRLQKQQHLPHPPCMQAYTWPYLLQNSSQFTPSNHTCFDACSFRLQQALPSALITIYADKFGSDLTSHGAAGVWQPYKLSETPEVLTHRWAGYCYSRQQKAAADTLNSSNCSNSRGVAAFQALRDTRSAHTQVIRTAAAVAAVIKTCNGSSGVGSSSSSSSSSSRDARSTHTRVGWLQLQQQQQQQQHLHRHRLEQQGCGSPKSSQRRQKCLHTSGAGLEAAAAAAAAVGSRQHW